VKRIRGLGFTNGRAGGESRCGEDIPVVLCEKDIDIRTSVVVILLKYGEVRHDC
jgi:hypothetical protein